MLLVTGGAGFIGSNFVLSTLAATGEPVVNLDKLTYAGNERNLASLKGDARHTFVRGDICDRDLVGELLRRHRPRAIVHFAAESHVDRSITGPAAFVQTNVTGTFSLLEEARALFETLSAHREEGLPLPPRLHGRGIRNPRAGRSGVHRGDALRAEQSLRGVQGGVGPPGACVPSHLRPADAHDELLEQLRPAPVPGEADPAHDPPGAGGQAATGLWRRQERARLALCRRPLRRGPPGPREGPGGRDLQHRRRERAEEHRPRPHAVRPARQGQAACQGPLRRADQLREGSSRPRPPLCDEHRQDPARARLGAEGKFRVRAGENRALVSREHRDALSRDRRAA